MKIRPLKDQGLSVSGLEVPGDKSISHRAVIFASIADGISHIRHRLNSADVDSTIGCMKAMGVKIDESGDTLTIHGKGLRGLSQPKAPLDCGNSGTTMRLLMGLLAGQDFSATLIGDASLSQRPMRRVAEPLRLMGANIDLGGGKTAPVRISGQPLSGIEYPLPVASAQIKSAVLLAGLYATGKTVACGEIHSRDHTERLLPHFGIQMDIMPDRIGISSGQNLKASDLQVPGDLSSAAFWLTAASIVPGSELELVNVSLNPTRTGIIEVLETMGARIQTEIKVQSPEPMGRIHIKQSPLKALRLDGSNMSLMVDEVPLVALLATQAKGHTIVRGAEELRIKECDRLNAITENLRHMGATMEEHRDGFDIFGPQKLDGARIRTFHDHRIAMTFAVAALIASVESQLDHPECVGISYPGFFEQMKKICPGCVSDSEGA